jgi:hypothetical protein
MAIPSGSGTEVLKRASFHALSDTWTAVITGVANHIYTVLSVVASEQGDSAESIYMRVDISAAGSNQVGLLQGQSLSNEETFIWNDKIVLTGTDKLEVYNTPGNVDWYVTYIDQDWT